MMRNKESVEQELGATNAHIEKSQQLNHMKFNPI